MASYESRRAKLFLECQACQCRKTAPNRLKLLRGYLVDRPFQRILVHLVESISQSVLVAGAKGKIIFAMMAHSTRCTLLLPIPNKSADTVAKATIDCISGIFGLLQTMHSDRGPEFENSIIYPLQSMLGHQKKCTTPYRPQGNPVSERAHSTMHAMLAMHSSTEKYHSASLLTFVQLAHNRYFCP